MRVLAGLLVAGLLVIGTSFTASADHKDIVSIKSVDGFKATLDRLVEALEKRNLTVFANVDHQRGARGVGLEMSPATVIIFGNPRAGTPVMQKNPLAGLDLPMRMLVSEDRGLVQVTYREPLTLSKTWHHGEEPLPVIAKMTGALQAIANEAAGKAAQ